MPGGPFGKNEGRYGTSLKVLGFSHSQKDLDGGGPNAQWSSASRGKSSQLGPRCTPEPSEAPLHPLSTLRPHSKPERVLFQPQDGAISLRAWGGPGQRKGCPTGTFLQEDAGFGGTFIPSVNIQTQGSRCQLLPLLFFRAYISPASWKPCSVSVQSPIPSS